MDKVKVTRAAVISRFKRSLEKDGKALKKSRAKYVSNLGTYYIVDVATNTLEHQDVDPVDWAKDAGLIKGWEVVE